MKKRTSRRLSILLVLCMVLAFLPGTALAADITYAVPGGNLYFDLMTGTITDCGENVTEAVIPSEISGVPVTSIGSRAFFGCESLRSVTIPEGVIGIGTDAFLECPNLASISFPSTLTYLGYSNPFRGTLWQKNQGDFVVANGILVAYQGSSSDVIIPQGVTYIFSSVFTDPTNHIREQIVNVVIPEGVTRIDDGVFNRCTNLTSITIPVSVTGVGNSFSGCDSLTDVYYGGSEEQWKAINGGLFTQNLGAKADEITGGNASLFKANIHYNSPVPGAPASTPAPAPSAGISVTVNGVPVAWTDAEPFIDENSRTMVPLRAVADAMGLDVNWDASAREASFTNGTKTIIFPIGSTTARTSDGGAVTMDTAAIIRDGRTYAPIRYLAEYFGYTVGWDAASRTVTIA